MKLMVANNLIMDVGLHIGQDTEFYLKKGFNVVAIEANPLLVAQQKKRFSEFIADGRLNILNVGIGPHRGTFTFYVNDYLSEWSSFDKAIGSREGKFHEIEVEMIPLEDIMHEYGIPYYLKIDIEGYDFIALKSIRVFEDKPRFVSVENGQKPLLDFFYAQGYTHFKFINQKLVPQQKVLFPAKEGVFCQHIFPHGASGLFGEEAPGKWLDYHSVLELIEAYWNNPQRDANIDGWFDLHARRDLDRSQCPVFQGFETEKSTKKNEPEITESVRAETEGKIDFNEYTYSKRNHFNEFESLGFDLHKDKREPYNCDLKVYQDLLVWAFIKKNIPEGAAILEIGGGGSRIIDFFKNSYECWNLDKLEGIGNGPKKINTAEFRLVEDYIGNFNQALPVNYFDFVFSISVLEHVPETGDAIFRNILDDIERVLKPGGLSLHCLDVVLHPRYVWTNKILHFIFNNQKTINSFIDFSKMVIDPDIFYMSEFTYHRDWEHYTKKKYEEFGKPASYNILWQKPLLDECR